MDPPPPPAPLSLLSRLLARTRSGKLLAPPPPPAAPPTTPAALEAPPAAAPAPATTPSAPHVALGATFITQRIIIAPRPSMRGTDLADGRVGAEALAKWLGARYSEGSSFALFNLSTKGRAAINYALFNNAVVEFPPATRADLTDETPGVDEICRFIYSLKMWLAWDPATVAIVFCNTGVARSCLFVSLYLFYDGGAGQASGHHFGSAEAALAAVGQARLATLQAAGLQPAVASDGGLVLRNSWRMLVAFAGRVLRPGVAPSLPKAHTLSHAVVHLPLLRAHLAGTYPVVQLLSGPKLLWSSLDAADCGGSVNSGTALRWDGDKLIVTFNNSSGSGATSGRAGDADSGVSEADGGDLVLCGDYSLWLLLPPQRPRQRVLSHDGEAQPPQQAARGDGHQPLDPAQAVLRLVFHSSMLEPGVFTAGTDLVDVFRHSLVDNSGGGAAAAAAPVALMAMSAAPTGGSGALFSLSLVLGAVSPAVVAATNLDRLARRSFINLRGLRALQQAANDFSAHHYVLPSPGLLLPLTKEGYDEVACVCALQRADNIMGRAREALDAPAFKALFRESAAQRDLSLLRETLSLEEVAAALAVRANMAVRARGLQLDQLDCSALLAAARLGNLLPDGEGDGTGGAGAGGLGPGLGGGRRHRRRGKKDGKAGSADEQAAEDEAEGSASDRGLDSADSSGSVSDGHASKASDAAAAADLLVGSAAAAGKLFAGDASAADDAAAGAADQDGGDDDEDEGDEGGEEPWTMGTHPIFGAWLAAIAGGRPRAELQAELEKDGWNACALLGLAPAMIVPGDVAATTVDLKDWPLVDKFVKMSKVGLPRPIIEHAMAKDNLSPSLLDAPPASRPKASAITPLRRRKAKVLLIRKKLHWVPIRGGRIANTAWAGPPADVVAAASQLIRDRKRFLRLFTQKPEDAARRNKSGQHEGTGPISLVDHKRAMNAGISLAKMRLPVESVAACLRAMSCRAGVGGPLLSGVELQNLVQLAPSEDEVKLVKGFRGDVNRLGACEKFFLAVADVPNARARAQGLLYQFSFDEQLREARRRLQLFCACAAQVRGAERLQRFLKAVLVLGNAMNGITAKNRKGCVRAFTLASLHQLLVTKTFEGLASEPPQPVLEYLVGELEHVDQDLLRLSADFGGPKLPLLNEARRLPLDVMLAEGAELRQGLASVEALVRDAAQSGGAGVAGLVMGGASGCEAVTAATYVEEEEEEGAESPRHGRAGNDKGKAGDKSGEPAPASAPAAPKRRRRRRVEPLPAFAALAQIELAALQRELEAATTAFRDLLAYFKEDAGDGQGAPLAADELFGSLHLFLLSFDATLRRIADRRAKDKAARRRAAAKALGKGGPDQGQGGSSGEDGEGGEGGEGAAKAPAGAWAGSGGAVDGADADADDGNDDEAPAPAPPQGPVVAAAPSGLLASIRSKAAPAPAPAPAPGPTAAAGRDGLLSAIKARAPKPASAAAGGDARGGLLAAIAARKPATPPAAAPAPVPVPAPAPSPGADPRGGLMAAIAARRKAE